MHVEVKPKRAKRGTKLQLTVRMRTKREMELVKRAARAFNISVNTLAADLLATGAESALRGRELMAEMKAAPQPTEGQA